MDTSEKEDLYHHLRDYTVAFGVLRAQTSFCKCSMLSSLHTHFKHYARICEPKFPTKSSKDLEKWRYNPTHLSYQDPRI